MSKLFKISGNFTENGEWTIHNPAFAGEIAVDENGKFCGWCEQIYAEGSNGHYDEKPCENNKTRCVVGALAEENHGYSLLFFKLSNDEWQTPLSYEIHTDSTADCVWSAKDPGGGFVAQGNAMVTLEEIHYSKSKASRIRNHFRKMYTSTIVNDTLLQEVGSWKKKTLVLWT